MIRVCLNRAGLVASKSIYEMLTEYYFIKSRSYEKIIENLNSLQECFVNGVPESIEQYEAVK